MNGVLLELKHGLRALWRSKGFAVLAMVTLGLGVGANAAVFAVANGVLLRAFPWEDADRLVRLWSTRPGRGLTYFSDGGIAH